MLKSDHRFDCGAISFLRCTAHSNLVWRDAKKDFFVKAPQLSNPPSENWSEEMEIGDTAFVEMPREMLSRFAQNYTLDKCAE